MSKYKIKNSGYAHKKEMFGIKSKKVNSDKIPYCENPALGIDAPKCSEDCCSYGGCTKKEYFDHIANKYNTTPEKIAICANFQSDKYIIDDREYTKDEVLNILKRHKEEEDKKYNRCFRCKNKYLNNTEVNMVKHHLHESSINNIAYAYGYATTPYIIGFKVLSTCGNGKDVKLCDNCIKELISWLGEFNYE